MTGFSCKCGSLHKREGESAELSVGLYVARAFRTNASYLMSV